MWPESSFPQQEADVHEEFQNLADSVYFSSHLIPSRGYRSAGTKVFFVLMCKTVFYQSQEARAREDARESSSGRV